eukprot:gb/GECG01007948.1/.p1 GENE.gb/GECG01007948.1/~~gb/GECG01007948.1/.p1  ORF type:complete len:140 (+),score=14.21 gb/GECG01007948.1/:1-420(+)
MRGDSDGVTVGVIVSVLLEVTVRDEEELGDAVDVLEVLGVLVEAVISVFVAPLVSDGDGDAAGVLEAPGDTVAGPAHEGPCVSVIRGVSVNIGVDEVDVLIDEMLYQYCSAQICICISLPGPHSLPSSLDHRISVMDLP